MKYKFSKGLKKGVVSLIVFGLPFFITSFPDIANLSIGAGLTIIVNFVKIKFS